MTTVNDTPTFYPKSKNASDRLIIALDVPTQAEALQLVNQTRDFCSTYKIGLTLFIAEGPQFVRRLADLGVDIFLDLKLHDIPATVSNAISVISQLPVSMVTLHALAGPEVLKAARTATDKISLLAVSVLTHHTPEELRAIGFTQNPQDLALQLLKPARAAGLNGCICSPHETRQIKNTLGNDFIVVNPGIRPAFAATNDQKRIMTPFAAIREGADFLVVGRPITSHSDPQTAAKAVYNEIDSAIHNIK